MNSVRGFLGVAVLILIMGIFSNRAMSEKASLQGEMRVWTDLTGREIRAVLTGFQDKNTLILRLADGRNLPYPINKLSDSDGVFAREAYGSRAKGGGGNQIDWNNPKQSNNYVIRGMRRQNAPGFVSTKSGWEWRVKSIEVKVQYKGGADAAPGEIRAYFYNRDGKLIDTFAKPPRRQDDDRKYIDAPVDFKKNKTVEVYFPLTPFIVESKWATVLIAFGSGSDYSAKTMSGESLEKIAFVEKKYLFPEWKAETDAGDVDPQEMSNVSLEVRRVQQKTHPYSVIFDGDYQIRKPCVMAEVRAKGEVSPGTGSAILHVFDKSGKLVSSRMKPSSASVKGRSSYVSSPQIADDEWHPVFFALDGDLTGKSYPTYVVVFEFGGKTAAAIKSSTGATLNSLDFFEKDNIALSGEEDK